MRSGREPFAKERKPPRRDEEEDYVLHSPRLGLALILLMPVVLLLLDFFFFFGLGPEHLKSLGPAESLVVLLALTIQLMSLLQQATRSVVGGMQWTSRIVFGVKMGAAWTNYLLYTRPTPFIDDPITGRPNCMLRWSEWTVMAFIMAFLIDGTDSLELWKPLRFALFQGVSTFIGACLPMVSTTWLWMLMLSTCVVLFCTVYTRLFDRYQEFQTLKTEVPSDSYHLCKLKLAMHLNMLSGFFWTLLVILWGADGIARVFFSYSPAVDWCFISDCLIDVAAKLYYADILDADSQLFPVRFRLARGQLAASRMEAVWNDATDCIIVSQRLANGKLTTAASPSLSLFVGEDEAVPWVGGLQHGSDPVLAQDSKPPLPLRTDVLTLDELVPCAWWHSKFSCDIAQSEGKETARACEISASVSDDAEGCVIVLRDVTDRNRLFEMEREILSASIERYKDEEANRFTRHEVKNGVLAAISQLDALQMEHGNTSSTFDNILRSMRIGLSQTLETVLSQAMARDVLHGNYKPRTSPCSIIQALGGDADGNCSAKNKRFPMKTTPATGFPMIDVDRRLLTLVYRNAISNACRYGKPNGIVLTEIDLEDGILTIRVINEPGPDHDHLCELSDKMRASEQVFAKGVRLHKEDALHDQNSMSAVSKGDGGWIMKKCMDCMNGSCSIRFEKSHTVFEMCCPAPEPFNDAFADSADLSHNVWAMGVEDSPQQRRILLLIFKRLGIPDERIIIIGGDDEEIKNMVSYARDFFQSIPKDASLLMVVDENLDLGWPSEGTISGSSSVKVLRESLGASEEKRLLALVRSANDSQSDVQSYLERAHGFLNKAPGEPDRTTILRAWVQRFGMTSVTLRRPESDFGP